MIFLLFLLFFVAQAQDPCRVIFPVLASMGGDLGGVDGADSICFEAANATGSKLKASLDAGNISIHAFLG